MNYRGYGRSGGRPGERQLLADALLLYDRVTRRPDVDPGRVAVMGRSIGSGVAVYVARERPVLGAVLVSPYDSVAAVARDAFPYLPVPLLLRHRFEAASWAAGVRAPLLALIAGDDRVIDPRALPAGWRPPGRAPGGAPDRGDGAQLHRPRAPGTGPASPPSSSGCRGPPPRRPDLTRRPPAAAKNSG